MLCRLLFLVCLCLAHQADSTSVHEVSISVRSVKSIVYRGMQVSIFEHTQMPRRYFFQPLSFLDTGSARLSENSHNKLNSLHFDVLLWTDEFIQLVESHFPDQRSVEMLPLTEISLAWSKQAPVWLGEDYNRTYRLLDDWKDGDKPHMRSKFTLFCELPDPCKGLLQKFNHSDEAVGHLFDLRYKVQCDNSRNFSLSVRSAHFLQSTVFQQMDNFASRQLGEGRVIVSEQTVDELADQVYTAALVELQRDTKQQIMYVDGESRKAVLTDLHRYLRSDPVHSLTKIQWESQVSWPNDRLSLRPDKLSFIFNALFKKAAHGPQFVELTTNDSLSTSTKLKEVRESIPAAEYSKVEAFVRRYTPRRRTDPKPPVPVDEVRELSHSLASPVAWNVSVMRFEPATNTLMFRLDTVRIKRDGTLMIRDALVFYKETAHRDQVSPLPRSDPATDAACRSKVDRMDAQVQGLIQNVTLLERNLTRVSSELESWTSVYAPQGRGRPSSVNTRSSSGGQEFYLGAEESAEVGNLRRSLAALEGRFAAMTAGRAAGAYQAKFADSFCVLANRENPPGMTCQVLSMIIPKKSLRHSPIFDRRVRYQEGRIGQSHLTMLGGDFLNLSLKICCTA